MADFDVVAALIQQSQADLPSFMEALAVRLEGIVPGTEIKKSKSGIFSKEQHVQSIRVPFLDTCYFIELNKGGISAVKEQRSHGVVISKTSMSLGDWLTDLVKGLTAYSESTAQSSSALEKFLMG